MPAEFTIRAVPSLREVDPAAWDACANPKSMISANNLGDKTDSICEPLESTPPASSDGDDPMAPIDSRLQQEPFNPFLTHAFLYSLEESGSATARTGWAGTAAPPACR